MTNETTPISNSILNSDSASTIAATHANVPPTPQVIGSYRVLELLGTGGMGEVYKAERRHPIRQTVAIKIIKLGYDSREVIARFESERQALARMDDPGIARVLDAGVTETGRPYFVMEYVPGVPITKFCDDNNLTIKERLLLFTQACDAIAHAHTKAIIHRDIKGANVLAYMHDKKPRVKVIDFGIAKALTGDRLTDATFNTEHGRIVGTYDSMSPEQADGSPDIDTRTDVYSLGVLLYELLTGSKPFDYATLAKATDVEIKRIIREVEPPRPGARLTNSGEQATKLAERRRTQLNTLARQLKSELEWIPLKAMRKDRGRRYASPSLLKEDIENYLAGKPLLAGPETRTYRISKFVRRNAGNVAASAVVLALLIGGIVFYIHRISTEQSRTQSALQEARKQGEEAARQADTAEAVAQFLGDMLASADPDGQLGNKVTVVQAIEAAVKDLDAGKLKDQPLIEAAVRGTIGETLYGLGELDAALVNMRRTLEIRRKHLPPDDPGISVALSNMSMVLSDQGNFTEAETLQREGLAIDRKRLPPGDMTIAVSLNNLGTVLHDLGKLAEAEQVHREALVIRRAAMSADDPRIAIGLGNLALSVKAQGRLADAEPLLHEALRIDRKASGDLHPRTATSLNNLAILLRDQDKFAEAEPLFREALDIRRKVLPADHHLTALSLDVLASNYKSQKNWSEAETLYREAVAIRRKALPANHYFTAQSLSTLAYVLREQGRLDEAEPIYREALAMRKIALGANAGPTIRTASELANLLTRANRREEAAALRSEFGLTDPTTQPSTVAPAASNPQR